MRGHETNFRHTFVKRALTERLSRLTETGQKHRGATFPHFKYFQVIALKRPTYIMEREGSVVHAFGYQRADAWTEKRSFQQLVLE